MEEAEGASRFGGPDRSAKLQYDYKAIHLYTHTELHVFTFLTGEPLQ